MHTSISILTFLLAALTTASPLAQGPSPTQTPTVILLVGLELNGDAATTRQIPFGNLFINNNSDIPAASSLLVNGGINVPVPSDQIVCQAFLDATATQKAEPPFNSTFPGVAFENLTTIGSIFCSDAEGVAGFKPPVLPPAKVQQVRIQLDFDSEGAAQADVPVNGQLTPNNFATNVASDGRIISQGAGGVSCEVFSDVEGRESVGVLEGNQEVVFSGGREVPVGAIRCVQ